MTNVLSIDPGGTTGLAVSIGGEIATCVTRVPEEVWGMCQRFDIIIVERFSTSGILSAAGLHTIEIVGGVKAACFLYEKELIIHMPQHRYAFQNAAHQMLVARHVPFVIHEEDALAHLLAYQERGK